MKTYDVYGVGNALVDIETKVSDDLLQELNFPKGIMTLVDEAAQQRVLSHQKQILLQDHHRNRVV